MKRSFKLLSLFLATLSVGFVTTVTTKNIVENNTQPTVQTTSTENVETYALPVWMDYFTATESSAPNTNNNSNTDSDYSVDISFRINNSYTGDLNQIYIIPNSADSSYAIKLNGIQIGIDYSYTLQYDQWGVGTYQIQMGFGSYSDPSKVYSMGYVDIGHMDYTLNPVGNITTTTAQISYTINSWGETDNYVQWRVYEAADSGTIGDEVGWSTAIQPTTTGNQIINVTGLTSSTSYVAEIRVDGDNSTKQYKFFDTSINYSSIDNLTVTANSITSTSANLRFGYTQNDGNNIVQYRVYKQGDTLNDEAAWLTYPDEVVAVNNVLTISSYYTYRDLPGNLNDGWVLAPLESNTTYVVELRADGWNATIETISFTTGSKSTLSNVTVGTPTHESVQVSYTLTQNQGTGIVEYRVYETGTPLNSRGDWTIDENAAAGSNTIDIYGLNANTNYSIDIRVDEQSAITLQFKTEAIATISNVQFYTSLNEALVVYTLNDQDVQHDPEVTLRYRETGTSTWTTEQDTNADSGINDYTITGLQPNKTYDIEIYVDGVLNYDSAFSTNKYTYVKPIASNSITDNSATIIVEYFQYGGDGEVEFAFYETQNGNDENNPFVTWSAVTNGSYSGYTYSTSGDLVDGTSNTITFSNLSPATGYTIEMRDVQSKTTLSYSFVTSDGSKSQASNLYVSNIQDDTATATFTFTKGSSGSTEYYWAVETVSTDINNYDWTLVQNATADGDVSTETVYLTDLEPSTQYIFAVKVDSIPYSYTFSTNASGVINNVQVNQTTLTDDYAQITYNYNQNSGDVNDVYYRYYVNGTDTSTVNWIKITPTQGSNSIELRNLYAGTNYAIEFKVDGVISNKTLFTTDMLTTIEPEYDDEGNIVQPNLDPTSITYYFNYQENSGNGVVEYRWYSTQPEGPEDGWVEMTEQEKQQGYVVIGDDEGDLVPGTSYILEVRTDQYMQDASDGSTYSTDTYALGDYPTYFFETPQTTYASAQPVTNVTSTSATLNYNYYFYPGTGTNPEYRIIDGNSGETVSDWQFITPTAANGELNSFDVTGLTPDTYYIVEYRVYNPTNDNPQVPGQEEGAYEHSAVSFATLDVAHVDNVYVSNTTFEATNVYFDYEQNDGAGLLEYKVVETQTNAVVKDWTTYADPVEGTNVLYINGLDENTEYSVTFVTDKTSQWSETATINFVTGDDGFYILLVWIVVFMAMTIITSGAGLTYFIGKTEKRHNKDKKELESHITAKSMQQDAEIKKHLVEEHQKQAQEAEDKRLSV